MPTIEVDNEVLKAMQHFAFREGLVFRTLTMS